MYNGHMSNQPKTHRQREHDAAVLRNGTFERPGLSRAAKQRAARKDRRSASQSLRSRTTWE